MSSIYGKKLKISIFGQSHSAAVGAVIDGLPAGHKIDMGALAAFMARRAPGEAAYSTKRREADEPEIICGLRDGVTCGAPLTVIIRNTDARPGDYRELFDIPRPSHADYTAHVKYGGANDVSGGGHFSGRLTAPLCAAGAIALQLLGERGIEIAAHIFSIADVFDTPFDMAKVDKSTIQALKSNPFPTLDKEKSEKMLAAIEAARLEGDSVGGVIECAAVGVPAGLGDPMFDGMENRIASIVFGIPAVKGIEFGSGFGGANLRGSRNNDPFYADNGGIKTATNNHGGILGGISSGMPIIFRAAFKPTPSIAREQQSVSLSRAENVPLIIKGRHDPCIVPRATPCIEAAAALSLLDALLERYGEGM